MFDTQLIQFNLSYVPRYIELQLTIVFSLFFFILFSFLLTTRVYSIRSLIKLCATNNNNMKINSTWLPWLRALEVKYFMTTDNGTNERTNDK